MIITFFNLKVEYDTASYIPNYTGDVSYHVNF